MRDHQIPVVQNRSERFKRPSCISRLPALMSPWTHTAGLCQVVASGLDQPRLEVIIDCHQNVSVYLPICQLKLTNFRTTGCLLLVTDFPRTKKAASPLRAWLRNARKTIGLAHGAFRLDWS